MRNEHSEEAGQPSQLWQAKFLGFGSAWWLLVAPWLLSSLPNLVPGGSASLLGKVISGALSLSHWALFVCLLAAPALLRDSESAPAKEWAKWFLIGTLTTPVLVVLLLFLYSFLYGVW